jgi:hypothetical protein
MSNFLTPLVVIKDFQAKVLDPSSEMEFFDINLPRVFCSMLFTVPFTFTIKKKLLLGDFKEKHTSLWF